MKIVFPNKMDAITALSQITVSAPCIVYMRRDTRDVRRWVLTTHKAPGTRAFLKRTFWA